MRSMRFRIRCSVRLLTPLFAAAAITGCSTAPESFLAGSHWVAEKHKVSDASLQQVEGYPSIRLDSASRATLTRAVQTDALQDARLDVLATLELAHAQAVRSAMGEFDRLDDDAWREINRRYFDANLVPDDAQRDDIRQRYLASSESGYEALVERVIAADRPEALREIIMDIDARTQASIKTKGRTARALPWLIFRPFSSAAAKKIEQEIPQGSIDRDFAVARRYSPLLAKAPDESADPLTRQHWDLLDRYAPVVVQEINPDAAYEPEVDRFGFIIARAKDDIFVKPSAPTIYAYARRIPIYDETHVQLVYTFWYPEEAQADGKQGLETGTFDAPVLRITLDEHEEPILYETLDACGCYHRVYPTEAINRAARGQFGDDLEHGVTTDVQGRANGKATLVRGRVVENPVGAFRPVVRTTAGDHSIIDVAVNESGHAQEVTESLGYTLASYDKLERIPLPDGAYTSLFYENGLVKGGKRAYGKFLTPLGTLSAGQPRQRGTQLVSLTGALDFDDPALFEKFMAWPSHALAHQETSASDASGVGGAPGDAGRARLGEPNGQYE